MQRSSDTLLVDGRELRLTNLDKVYYPETGTKKAEVVAYYARIAPVLLPYIRGHPINMKRFPEGVTGESFYQKECPDHRPDWLPTVHVPHRDRPGGTDHCTVSGLADLLWMVNLGNIEMHPLLGTVGRVNEPTCLVFDLDPGAEAGLSGCCRVGLVLKRLLADQRLVGYPKTSGGKGLHVVVGFRRGPTFDATRRFARTIAQALQRVMPELVTDNMAKVHRTTRVFVDWSQNVMHKSTVCAYSMRARDRPSVSTPLTWDEVERGIADPESLRFGPDDVLARVSRSGDLLAPTLEPSEELPAWAFSGT